MALEERLREELNRSADSLSSGTEAQLAQVVAAAHRRQRGRRAGAALLAATLGIAGALGLSHLKADYLGRQPDPTTQSPKPTLPAGLNDSHAAIRNAVTGVWQSKPQASRHVLAAITSAGLTRADADLAIGDAQRWQAQVFFSFHGNGPVVIAQTWDPSDSQVALHIDDPQPYELLPHHRLQLLPVVSSTRLLFSYRIAGDRLTMRYLRADPHPLPDRAVARILAWTSAPLVRVD